MPEVGHVELQTARLLLRPLAEADAEALLEIHSDPLVMRYSTISPWTSITQAHELVGHGRDWLSTGSAICLGIVRKETGSCIGTCTLFYINRSSRRAEVGFILGSRSWGQGYMTEALVAFLDYAFRELDLNRVEADTDPRNVASTRTLEGLRFVKEGLLRERWITNGQKSDTALYGLLRSEWPGVTEPAPKGVALHGAQPDPLRAGYLNVRRHVATSSVAPALLDDLDLYVYLAQEAQAFLRGRGLAQWVPAAHAAYRKVLVARVTGGELYKVVRAGQTVAFFCLSGEMPEWWAPYPAPASYLSGIVVDRKNGGGGVGQLVLKWCEGRARVLNHDRLRLDCHAENGWLCSYYAALGFQEVTRVEQHPGYVGVLQEKVIARREASGT